MLGYASFPRSARNQDDKNGKISNIEPQMVGPHFEMRHLLDQRRPGASKMSIRIALEAFCQVWEF
jgi:hypothetical protein